jgi:anthranilate synthase component 1
MVYPQRSEFLSLSRTATLVPVAKSVSADLLTPVSAFLSIANESSDAFLLESVEGGEKLGRYTFLGVDPYMRVVACGDQIVIERGRRRERVDGDLLQVVRSLLRQHRIARPPGMPPFTGGAVGYFAYDMVRRLERLPSLAANDLEVPDCVLMFFNRLLAFDHVRHQIQIVALADVSQEPPKAAYDRALEDIQAIERRLASGLRRLKLAGHPVSRKLKVVSSVSREGFLKSVRRAKEYIAAGDAFQVVLSQRLEFRPGAAPFDIYRALRTLNPSPYMYFFRMGKLGPAQGGKTENSTLHVLGSSPEMLVRVTGKKLEYRPIAGTLPRGANEEEDRQLEQKLLSDEKERAEHIMLVDLGRNDIGRVSDYGSVEVRDLMYVERYSHVMHLVSAIEGRLRPELDALDAFAACFPAGTLSGAPKVRAMEIIEELEPVRRGIYGGSVMYADFSGNLDSCIAIRTMLMKGKKAYVQAGAGVVADSDPQREYEESLNKAQALVRAAETAG